MTDTNSKSLRLALLALALQLTCSFGSLHADEPAPPTDEETIALLMTDNFADLEQRYGAIQSAYREGRISEIDLRADFRTFLFTDESLSAHYEAWVWHSPGSYVAHLARGIYYKKIAQSHLSENDFLDAEDLRKASADPAMQLADRELNASLPLEAKPLMTYLHLINIRTFVGDQVGARKIIDQAMRLEPHSYVMSQNYMIALKTRWGGGVGEMQRFLRECQQSGLSADQLSKLGAIVAEEEAWTHRYVDKDTDAALLAYEKAAALNPEASCLPCGPIVKAGDAAMEAKRYDEAIKEFSKALDFDPNYLPARNSRAYAELQLDQLDAGLQDFLFSANRGDAYAEDMLGRLYLVGSLVPADRDKAIMWLKKAAAQNYGPSVQILPFALNKDAKPMLMPGTKF
ncbi:MAG TPA: DUF4034 domain-containing protein [Steroidobacteraceae bacterium]